MNVERVFRVVGRGLTAFGLSTSLLGGPGVYAQEGNLRDVSVGTEFCKEISAGLYVPAVSIRIEGGYDVTVFLDRGEPEYLFDEVTLPPTVGALGSPEIAEQLNLATLEAVTRYPIECFPAG